MEDVMEDVMEDGGRRTTEDDGERCSYTDLAWSINKIHHAFQLL